MRLSRTMKRGAVAALGLAMSQVWAGPGEAQSAPGPIDILGAEPGQNATAIRADLLKTAPRLETEDERLTLTSQLTSWAFTSKRRYILQSNGGAPTDEVDAILEPRSEASLALRRFKRFDPSTQVADVLISDLVRKYGQPAYAYGLDGRPTNVILVWSDRFGPGQAAARFSARQSSLTWQFCRFRAEAYGGQQTVSTLMNYIASNDVRADGEERCGRMVVAELERQVGGPYMDSMELYSVDLAEAHARMADVTQAFFGQANDEQRRQVDKDKANSPAL